jgi:hypothetical protein
MAEVIKEAKTKKIYNVKEHEAGDKTVDNYANVLDIMEEEYPVMMGEFKRLQKEQYELFTVKQHDYGPHNISMGSDLKTKEDVNFALMALVIRINDKVNRLMNLIVKKGGAEGAAEPALDAFSDLANYGIMAQIVANKKWGK